MSGHTSRSATPRIVLASQSPRRRDLLTLIGVPHQVRPADVDETPLPGEEPVPHAERLARAKARRLADEQPGVIVVAADTIVVIDGRILGKPADDAEAGAMLRSLSGRTHTVHTAVAVARDGVTHSAVESVAVTFRALDDDEVARLYAATRRTLTTWIERLGAEPGFPEKVTAFRPEMAVHGKYKAPCPVCQTSVARIAWMRFAATIAERPTSASRRSWSIIAPRMRVVA